MCGIVGYIGDKNSVPILIKGLQRLEYRGYDSAGVAVLNDGILEVHKQKGKVAELNKIVKEKNIVGNIGIAHTRWATHGIPNKINAHPHTDVTGKFTLVHNGIIENYGTLRQILQEDGVEFSTDTDTESLVQLISKLYHNENYSFEEAVRVALRKVIGAYGIVVLCKDEPDKIIAARLGSPLVLGIGDGEYFIGSDASPIIEYTKQVVYLDEGDVAIIKKDGYTIKKVEGNNLVRRGVTTLDMTVDQIEKGNFPHFMLKEIFEQERTITDTMRGRLNLESGKAHLGGISDHLDEIKNASRIYITACGTSWHAGLIGKFLIEKYARIPVHVEYASEFRYRDAIIDDKTVIIAISQSGETADTLAAIRKGKEYNALTVGICNVVGSSISRETDCGVYTHAGPEIGVASTKAFTAQVTVLIMIAMSLADEKLSAKNSKSIAMALSRVSDQVKTILSNDAQITKVAEDTQNVNHYLYLGRGLNFPVALEGALKLKEISYIHAEGYPAAEMKHGPIALIDEMMPVVVIAPYDHTYEKVLSNIQEVKARKGKVIIVTDHVNDELEKLADYLIAVPKTHNDVFPLLASIPLQLLAYHIAVLRGCNVDQPRNLAKSVTVE